MFTGIVEAVGTIREIARTGGGARIVVRAGGLDLTGTSAGDSIAVDGCCLTAVSVERGGFAADASHETLDRTTLGRLVAGAMVNLERSLRLGDRLGGHIVQGHIDGVGRVVRIASAANAADYHLSCPPDLRDFVVEKGSIAVDGISLTVNGVSDAGFHVTLIPHTARVTTLGAKGPGSPVNLETDVVGKYIVSLARRGRLSASATGLTLEKLEEHGFA